MSIHPDSDVLFLYANEGIMVCDIRGTMLRVNPACAQLFGYTIAELEGKCVEMLVPHHKVDEHRSSREKFHHRPHVRSFGSLSGLTGLHKNGHEIHLEISLSPFRSRGELFTIAFVVDNTYRWEAEQKLRQYAERLEQDVENRTLILREAVEQLEHTKVELSQALDKEKELNHLKTRFVSIASHEFRTPLATILSSLGLLKKYADKGDIEKRDKHIDRIRGSIAALSDILDDFLSLSKVEEGLVENNPRSFELPAFMEAVVEELRTGAADEQVIRYTHEGLLTVNLDPKPLKTVLVNLITNALKYSPPDRAVEVRTRVDAQQVHIEIEDHGIGIPEEDLAHVFERFFRAHNVMHIKGTGLGLNIVSKFVEVMKGRLQLQSSVNVGTTVYLDFLS